MSGSNCCIPGCSYNRKTKGIRKRSVICQGTKLFHRNKDLHLLFSSRLSLILCCCFSVLSLSFFGMFLKCFLQFGYMLNFIVGVITNLQSLNPEHTGKPIVC